MKVLIIRNGEPVVIVECGSIDDAKQKYAVHGEYDLNDSNIKDWIWNAFEYYEVEKIKQI